MAGEGRSDGVDDGRLVALAQTGIHGERHGTSGGTIGDRQVGLDSSLDDVLLAVDRDRIEDPRPDARLLQVGDDGVTLVTHVDGVLVIDVGAVVRHDRDPDPEPAKPSS